MDDETCLNNLRMSRNAFAQLCHLVEHAGGLESNQNINIKEQLGMFLAILAHHTQNRIVKHNYKRSARTVSKHFHGVLNVIIRLHYLLHAQLDPISEDCTDQRWKCFKVLVLINLLNKLLNKLSE